MPPVAINGATLYYELTAGTGPVIALMSGGRSDHTRLPELRARFVDAGYRVLTHDRRNCGISDIVIDGDDAEYEIWADDLYALLERLEITSAIVAGASSGCRTAIAFALRHPEALRALLLIRITGGPFAAAHLANEYYGQFIAAAEQGGMEAVCALGHFKERIAARANNRDYLVGLGAERFIAQMTRWRAYYERGADQPILGATEAESCSIVAPACIIAGNDRTHPREVAFRFGSILPNAQVHDVIGPQRDIIRTPLDEWDVKTDEIAAIFIRFLREIDAAPSL